MPADVNDPQNNAPGSLNYVPLHPSTSESTPLAKWQERSANEVPVSPEVTSIAPEQSPQPIVETQLMPQVQQSTFPPQPIVVNERTDKVETQTVAADASLLTKQANEIEDDFIDGVSHAHKP